MHYSKRLLNIFDSIDGISTHLQPCSFSVPSVLVVLSVLVVPVVIVVPSIPVVFTDFSSHILRVFLNIDLEK
tara:strand:+ start:483 stop:698 length:216 start_codon:yes stop_codon:yes gene_type:complete